MNESYYDESVKMHDDVLAKKTAKRKRFKIYGIVGITLFFILLFLTFSWIVPEEELAFSWLVFALLTFMLPGVLFLFAGVFFLLFRTKLIVEYDYSYVDGNIRIAKIFSGIRRRGLCSFNCVDIVTVGKVDGDDCKKYEQMPDIKFILATPNLDIDNSDIYYVIIHDESGRIMIYFQPSIRLLTDMRKSARRNIFEG